MKINKATPIHFVEAIEPALPFWRALGWNVEVEVPHGNKIGFVILKSEDRELMLQTHASLAEDLPQTKALAPKHAFYMDVDSLDSAKKALDGERLLVDERTTFYGARECWVVDPAGVLIGFAEMKK
ncbi:MAG: hypothetical protein ABI461_10910 [Polyangiaceae bacterium]